MTDNVDFERRFKDRLLAHASLASRPFDAHQIAASASVGARSIGRSQLRLRPVALLLAAVLLLILAAALTVGTALPWLSADADVAPPPLTRLSPPAVVTPSGDPEVSTPRADPEVVYAPMTWTSLPAMTTPRSSHTATVLADGRVLVAGGLVEAEGDAPTSAEIFDPATSSWTSTGSMTTARTGHNALLLADGRVVVIGGNSPTSGSAAEVWDPSTGEWAAIGGLIPVPRDSAALLSDGRILVAGGSGRTRASLLDLATGTWTQTDHYSEARYNVSLVTLRDGTLLLVGGDHLADRGMALVERYEPSSNGWSVVGSLKPQTHAHSIALLDDGRILAIGSERPSQEFAQLFDPVSGQSTFVNTPLAAWAGGDAVRLPDGRVLFASGEGAGYFDPASESWVSIPPMPDPRSGATMSLLRTSAVLIAGGWTSPDGASTIPSAAVNLLR